MLKTRAGDVIGNVPAASLAPGALTPPREAYSVQTAAIVAEISRSTLYKAMNKDPAKRGGLPFLASIKVGAARRIRPPTLRQWLTDLEYAATSDEVA